MMITKFERSWIIDHNGMGEGLVTIVIRHPRRAGWSDIIGSHKYRPEKGERELTSFRASSTHLARTAPGRDAGRVAVEGHHRSFLIQYGWGNADLGMGTGYP